MTSIEGSSRFDSYAIDDLGTALIECAEIRNLYVEEKAFLEREDDSNLDLAAVIERLPLEPGS